MNTTTKQTFHLNGLSCTACKKLIEKKISSLPTVLNVEVDFNSGRTDIVTTKELSPAVITNLLTDTPYSLKK